MPAFIIEILINFYAWVRNTTINVCLLAQIVCPFGNSCFVFFVFLDSGFNHSWEILLEITGNPSHACRINLKLFFLSFYELLKMIAQKNHLGHFQFEWTLNLYLFSLSTILECIRYFSYLIFLAIDFLLVLSFVFFTPATTANDLRTLVWRGPWLGIEPGTSCTRSQHSTTRLSRRRFISVMKLLIIFSNRLNVLPEILCRSNNNNNYNSRIFLIYGSSTYIWSIFRSYELFLSKTVSYN